MDSVNGGATPLEPRRNLENENEANTGPLLILISNGNLHK